MRSVWQSLFHDITFGTIWWRCGNVEWVCIYFELLIKFLLSLCFSVCSRSILLLKCVSYISTIEENVCLFDLRGYYITVIYNEISLSGHRSPRNRNFYYMTILFNTIWKLYTTGEKWCIYLVHYLKKKR